MSAKKKKTAKTVAPKARREITIPENVNWDKLRPQPLYGISRVDVTERGFVGWTVRVGLPGAKTNTYFSDRMHGGTEKALKKAKTYRNGVWESLPDTMKYKSSRPRKRAGA